MLIKFKLQGVERIIKQNGPNDFVAYEVGNPDRALGYYSSLQNAVLRHIKDAGSLDEGGKEEVIELKNYVERFNKLCDEIRGAEPEDLLKDAVFEARAAKVMTEETKAKIAKTKSSKKVDQKPELESQEESFGDDF